MLTQCQALLGTVLVPGDRDEEADSLGLEEDVSVNECIDELGELGALLIHSSHISVDQVVHVVSKERRNQCT